MEAGLPELHGRGEVYGLAMNDLNARGLIGVPISGMVSQHALYDKLTSSLGDRFLDFIRFPDSI